jgi:hypothetical protein
MTLLHTKPPEPGWYFDSSDPRLVERYWDGETWSDIRYWSEVQRQKDGKP